MGTASQYVERLLKACSDGDLDALVATTTGWQRSMPVSRQRSASRRRPMSQLLSATCKDDLYGDTALHVAAAAGHVEIVRKLLRLGAHYTKVNARGKTPLDLAVDEDCRVELEGWHKLLVAAQEAGHSSSAAHTTIEKHEEAKKCALQQLNEAVARAETGARVVNALTEAIRAAGRQGIDQDHQDLLTQAEHWLARHSLSEALCHVDDLGHWEDADGPLGRFLLEQIGARLDALEAALAPAHAAGIDGTADAVARLARLRKLETDALEEQEEYDVLVAAMCEFAAKNDIINVRRLVRQRDIDVNAVHCNSMAELLASSRLTTPSAEPPDNKALSRPSPLRAAAYCGHIEVLGVLLELGANCDAVDGHGQSALHWAAYAGHTRVCARLLAAGANARLRDHAGSTPLALATVRSTVWATSREQRVASRPMEELLTAVVLLTEEVDKAENSLTLRTHRGCDFCGDNFHRARMLVESSMVAFSDPDWPVLPMLPRAERLGELWRLRTEASRCLTLPHQGTNVLEQLERIDEGFEQASQVFDGVDISALAPPASTPCPHEAWAFMDPSVVERCVKVANEIIARALDEEYDDPEALERVITVAAKPYFEALLTEASRKALVRAHDVTLPGLRSAAKHAAERAALGVRKLAVPNEFLCPISCCVMQDPVTASDGHSYERSYIEEHLKHQQTLVEQRYQRWVLSPLTRERMRVQLVPNITLRKLIEDFDAREYATLQNIAADLDAARRKANRKSFDATANAERAAARRRATKRRAPSPMPARFDEPEEDSTEAGLLIAPPIKRMCTL